MGNWGYNPYNWNYNPSPFCIHNFPFKLTMPHLAHPNFCETTWNHLASLKRKNEWIEQTEAFWAKLASNFEFECMQILPTDYSLHFKATQRCHNSLWFFIITSPHFSAFKVSLSSEPSENHASSKRHSIPSRRSAKISEKTCLLGRIAS